MATTKTMAPLSVTQLNTYVKSLLDGDERLNHIFICGEISNFTNHYRSGHFYFSLKDERCAVKAVMFSSQARRIRFAPEDGMCVLARGRVSLYEQTGQYQFYVEDMQPDGLGALNLAFEQMKRRLGEEGLFDEAGKKPLPAFPMRIGVITSPTGAAVHDIVTILERRWPVAEVVFCPVPVQGEGAADQLAEALRRMNRIHCADVIIIGRGGGSIEDLWAFNEEKLARAVAASSIPVVSAVGHETDFTICDFVADLRAPTPSAAAELTVPDWEEVAAGLAYRAGRLCKAMEEQVRGAGLRLDRLTGSRAMRAPEECVALRRMRLDDLENRMQKEMDHGMQKARSRLGELSGRLHALSPLAVLARGYAVARHGGEAIPRAGRLKPGERIVLQFCDGEAGCGVHSITLREERSKGEERNE